MKKIFKKLTMVGMALTMALGVGAVTYNSLNLNAEAAEQAKGTQSYKNIGYINSFQSHVIND